MRGLPILLLLGACAIAPPPPEADPVAGPPLAQGELATDPILVAACVSRAVPGAVVALRRDGAAVAPLPALVPDTALVVDRMPQGRVAWRLLGPPAGPLTEALQRALQDCAGRIGASA
ncbi:hypothetical protein [Paracraurococcus ruber]|uniref:Lipoprotein n=1 Tax=Paracraurococcus ruber TaxID=77675 RepID=A0ABS1CUW7_9PROT|nr:hypothetical protein [Paracraurococcus ruber]MBK1658179.1 hypothetical protein [Paracraurococcus ruber]TDG31808.1 hypothetical protein E2C05_09565 [Paracraurococcus ruber]